MKKIALLSAPLLAVTFLANCGGVNEYKVNITDSRVSIDKTTAKKNEDFAANIMVNEDVKNDYLLPSSLEKVTVGNAVLDTNSYTYSLSENSLSATFSLTKDKINGEITITISAQSRYVVSKNEFNDAISFKNVEYACANTNNGAIVNDYSPNVFHQIDTVASTFSNYKEIYIVKNGDTYNKFTRNVPNTDYIFVFDIDKAEFLTPKSMGDSLKTNLEFYGVNYDNLSFENNAYVANIAILGVTYRLKLIFNNKKLVEYTIEYSTGEILVRTLYTYEKTEPVPPKATRLTEEQFRSAISFENVHYMQASQSFRENDAVLCEQLSPEVYKCYAKSTDGDSNYYEEKIIKHDVSSQTNYIGYEREDENDDYNLMVSCDENDFYTPSDCPCSGMLTIALEVEYSAFDFNADTNTYSVLYNDKYGDKYDVSLQFSYNKVANATISITSEDGENITVNLTYKYEEITPVVPVAKKIDKHDFDDIISFRNIKYAQQIYISGNFSTGVYKEYNVGYSESVYRIECDNYSGEGVEPTYNDKIVKKHEIEGELTYTEFTRYDKNVQDYETREVSQVDFHTPESQEEDVNLYHILSTYSSDGAFNFSNYTYNNQSKNYTYEFVSSITGEVVSVTFEFVDNKVLSFELLNGSTSSKTMQFGYEKTTPYSPE